MNARIFLASSVPSKACYKSILKLAFLIYITYVIN